ncbi:MAG: hypothetical protein AB8F94_04075 [Saprospiraceae bacterium]
MIFLIGILITLGIPAFWFFLAKFTHFGHEKAIAYKNNELSKIDRLKINFHLAICFECAHLIDKPKEDLPLEEHLIDSKE